MLQGRDWHRLAGASESDLEALRSISRAALAESYFQLLFYSDGGEGPLPINPFYFQLDSVNAAIESIKTQNYGRSDLEGFQIIGSNGGGEYLAFDLRQESPLPIVMIDMVAGPSSVVVVASDFDAFLDLVGCDAERI
jgi:hypothetical protein